MSFKYLEENKTNNNTVTPSITGTTVTNQTTAKPKYRFVMGEKKRKAEASGQKFTDTWTPPKQTEDYFPEPISIEAFNALNPDGGNSNSLYSLKKAQREGTRIRNNLKNVLSQAKTGNYSANVFDDIDDDTIEKNIPLAEESLNLNKNRTLTKDISEKYPYYRDGMAMLYAADEKGNKNAARAAKYAAYIQSKLENENRQTTAPKVEEKNEPKVEANNGPKAQNGDIHIIPTGIRLFGNNVNTAQIENLYNSENNSTIKLSEDVYTTKKTNYKNTYKPENADVYGLSGDDLKIPFEERGVLAEYKKEYAKAEEELDYMKMNRIHKEAVKFRQQYYNYKDDYDYTHGGMYDIYTNYDDSDASYDENGHYEYVYKVDSTILLEFCEDIERAYTEGGGRAPSLVEEMLGNLSPLLSKLIESKIPKKIIKGSVPFYIYYKLLEHIYYDTRRKSEAAMDTTKSYVENLGSKEWNDNVDYYVYLLDGGLSCEVKIRAIDKNTKSIVAEGDFDLKQRKVWDAFIASAEENGDLKTVNRRFWKYSYVN